MKFKVGDVIKHKIFTNNVSCRIVSITEEDYEIQRTDLDDNDSDFQDINYIDTNCELELK